MHIPKIHRQVALIFLPFFILPSLTGILLLWRKNEIYGKEVKELFVGLHTWEIGAKYIGVILGSALLFLTISGLVIIYQTSRRKR